MSHTDSAPHESRSFLPWLSASDPRRILIIRLHAMGDVAITFPASAGLREAYPNAHIGFLTSDAAAPLARSLYTFDAVYQFPTSTHAGDWYAQAFRLGLQARRQNYEVVLDLQRNWATRIIRRLANPVAWGEFDRYSARAAGDRVLDTFHRAGFLGVTPTFRMDIGQYLQTEARDLLKMCGYDPWKKLIVLNPAGLWKTRNWPVENYVELAQLWSEHEAVQFIIIGTNRIADKASYIARSVGNTVLNLVEKTTPDVAFALLQHASAVITEDSGLMHMAWCSGIPVIALFGSSRHVWSAPTGSRVRVLHSGDLPCGQCMRPECMYNDVHCLTRHTPARVLELALELLSTSNRTVEIQ